MKTPKTEPLPAIPLDRIVRCPCCGSHLSAGIGGIVRLLRFARGWTLDELGKKSGLTKGYLSDLENGKRDIGLKSMNALAAAYGMTGSEMLKMHEERSSSPNEQGHL